MPIEATGKAMQCQTVAKPAESQCEVLSIVVIAHHSPMPS